MFCFFISFSNFTETFIYKFCLAILNFTIAGLQAFKLGPTLLRGPKKAIFPQPLSHCSIQLAVAVTVPEGFIKLSLTKNCKVSLGLFIAPVYTCHQKRNFSTT
uniref:Macaca fascicularis brain cDNA clone: QtrA-18692, similar to human hypothetical protein FLJ35867 (FLJ35867), mRNA, RefSeq: NM_152455.2 n=1 Tax=Macaca fascicularis TaxID=9541 RepID=I7GPN2_MACFA|nr:unnamed protein product [Macaca fascicularis]